MYVQLSKEEGTSRLSNGEEAQPSKCCTRKSAKTLMGLAKTLSRVAIRESVPTEHQSLESPAA